MSRRTAGDGDGGGNNSRPGPTVWAEVEAVFGEMCFVSMAYLYRVMMSVVAVVVIVIVVVKNALSLSVGGTRNKLQCLQRWYSSLRHRACAGLRYGPWTVEEV